MDARRLVGQNVRKYRLAADLSQEQVAERMGVDRAYVSGLELGNRNPTVITMWLIAEALKVSVASLLEEKEPSREDIGSKQRATKRSGKTKEPYNADHAVKVKDVMIWSKHIVGSNALRERIEELAPNAKIKLRVNGVLGVWQKANQSKEQHIGHALKPIGEARKKWLELYHDRASHGERKVSIQLA